MRFTVGDRRSLSKRSDRLQFFSLKFLPQHNLKQSPSFVYVHIVICSSAKTLLFYPSSRIHAEKAAVKRFSRGRSSANLVQACANTLLKTNMLLCFQLLRKRHIGNDIVTIVFQEPGSEPFNPQEMHSHFQHVFIVVRVHNPCSNNTCYRSVSVIGSALV